MSAGIRKIRFLAFVAEFGRRWGVANHFKYNVTKSAKCDKYLQI